MPEDIETQEFAISSHALKATLLLRNFREEMNAYRTGQIRLWFSWSCFALFLAIGMRVVLRVVTASSAYPCQYGRWWSYIARSPALWVDLVLVLPGLFWSWLQPLVEQRHVNLGVRHVEILWSVFHLLSLTDVYLSYRGTKGYGILGSVLLRIKDTLWYASRSFLETCSVEEIQIAVAHGVLMYSLIIIYRGRALGRRCLMA